MRQTVLLWKILDHQGIHKMFQKNFKFLIFLIDIVMELFYLLENENRRLIYKQE